jgi:methionine-rich copper-binding protein CopC
MTSRRLIPALLTLPLILGAWTTFHLDLVDSLPKEDQVLVEAPEVVWLEFSAAPDMSRSSFSIRGPEGSVELGQIETGDKEEVVRARVVGEMPAGDYTLSWVGAPIDDHTVRGRFDFTIEQAQ